MRGEGGGGVGGREGVAETALPPGTPVPALTLPLAPTPLRPPPPPPPLSTRLLILSHPVIVILTLLFVVGTGVFTAAYGVRCRADGDLLLTERLGVKGGHVDVVLGFLSVTLTTRPSTFVQKNTEGEKSYEDVLFPLNPI